MPRARANGWRVRASLRGVSRGDFVVPRNESKRSLEGGGEDGSDSDLADELLAGFECGAATAEQTARLAAVANMKLRKRGIIDPALSRLASCATSRAGGSKHACEKLHRVISRDHKKLDVKVSTIPLWIRYTRKRLAQSLVNYPVLRIPSWVECIFKHGGHFFLGGRTLDELPAVRQELRTFWQNYRAIDKDFPMFTEMPESKWGSLIPVAIHGDEGRGRLKNPVMVVSLQSLLPLHGKKTNMQGNSLCTRLLYAVLPAPFTKKSFHKLLSLLTDDLNSLWKDGMTVTWKGESHHFHFIVTGTKGDWPFLRSAYNLSCGFNCSDKCHRCCEPEWWNLKKMKEFPASTTNPSPFYSGDPSPLRSLPLGDASRYIRVDPAHTFAIDGVGKDFLASSIVIMVRAGHFGRGAIPLRFQNAYANFLAYCSAHGKGTSIADFGHRSFKLPANSLNQFPRGLGRGHDAGVLGAWLAEEVLQLCPASAEPQYREILEVIKVTCVANDRYWRSIYSHGMWIPRREAVQIVTDGWTFTDGYSTLAALSSRQRIYAFQVRPKLHMMGHITLDMDHQLKSGVDFVMSPTAHMTWADEDFIGKICRISRRTSPMTCAWRTIDRALGHYRRQFKINFSHSYVQG